MAKIRRYEVVLRPEDGNRWSAHCPVLLKKGGAAAFGKTRGEALKNLDRVIELVIEALQALGVAIPKEK